MKSEIKFIDEKLKEAFISLKNSKLEDKKLFEWLNRAFEDIENNVFCGIQVRKKLFPKEYKKYKITNLWKYDLPNGWRVIYTIAHNKPFVISLVLEWFCHKDYEKRFKYLI